MMKRFHVPRPELYSASNTSRKHRGKDIIYAETVCEELCLLVREWKRSKVADFQGGLNRCQNILMSIVASPAVPLAMTRRVMCASPHAARLAIRVLTHAEKP
jgi:hypothetical protein